MADKLQEVPGTQEGGFIDEFWDQKILPALEEYITIRCVSRNYDPDWRVTLPEAARFAAAWVEGLEIPGAQVTVETPDDRTPFLLIELPGNVDKTALLYGHLDKQPADSKGWITGPWTPTLIDGRLYGRGSADDGYAIFAAVAAMEALRQEGGKRCRAVICIEFDEESGSVDFPYYLEKFSAAIGDPGVLFFLDSGAGTYDRLWRTNSLRGILNGSLSAKVLTAPVHSGAGSGIIPDSFRILRLLLGRLERAENGEIIPPGLNVEIPEERKKEAAATAQILGDAIYKDFPTVEGLEPVTENLTQLYLNRSWRPQLTVVGQDGMPPAESAGNVIRPFTTLQLSLRLPPTLKAEVAQQIVSTVLTEAPPYDSEVAFEVDAAADGWNAAPSPPWLADVLAKTSENRFGKPAQVLLEGVSIGVLKMLEEKFPEAPFVVTGVLGPHSNAHGPNESLDLPFVKKLTGCVADVLSAFSQ